VMRLAACAFLVLQAGAASPAGPPPDDFRQEMVDALTACTAASGALAAGNDVSTSDDDEMRDAAREQQKEARRLLVLWSHLDEDEVADALFSASLEIDAEDFDDEDLLDLTIYCDDVLNDLLDTADDRGYTP
jgi:hypothetical protein